MEQKIEEQLSQLFGSYKAEWLKGKIFDLFTEPAYFPELKTSRPCMLVGGRGTGKTTVLRCLSYEGQLALSKTQPERISDWSFYGIYYRVNTNRVTAFKGPELEEGRWVKLFAHYLNLLMCVQMLKFMDWYKRHLPNASQLDKRSCLKVAKSFNINGVATVAELAENIENLLIECEAYVNNVVCQTQLQLSTQGVPIDILTEAMSQLPQFRDKNFFFLIDEYENFEDYQQQIVNTLIKHSGQYYSFKIGVRELGWRRRTTLNENEQLIHPADYVRINISETLSDAKFKEFAMAVCNSRIAKLQLENHVINNISDLLPKMTEEVEAEKLGVKELVVSIKEELLLNYKEKDISVLDDIPFLEAYFIQYWAESKNKSLDDTFKDYLDNKSAWSTRYQNYKHASLYTIRRGKRGIRKYYAGWDVFNKLAANNIRYLLELVDQSLLLHLKDGGKLSEPITPDIQTTAAQNVGQKNLSELEGLSVHGAKITKLLLGLGRIFQVMAEDIKGHTPEANQFHLVESDDIDNSEVEQLVTASVMHLALLRYLGNKLGDAGDTKDYDYMVHPIFSPFFVFSHRRKRKIAISNNQLLGLVNSPKETIREILLNNNRDSEVNLPDQLHLFEGYYFGHS